MPPHVASLQIARERSGGRTRSLPEHIFLVALSSQSKETSSYALVHTNIWRPGRPGNTACRKKRDMSKENERACKTVVVAVYSEATESQKVIGL